MSELDYYLHDEADGRGEGKKSGQPPVVEVWFIRNERK